MAETLNQPQPNEAYARLMDAQAQQRAASAVLDVRPVSEAIKLLRAPAADLRGARGTLGMSQAAMAEALGIDAPRLSKLENGDTVPRYIDLAVRCLLAMEASK
jgi:DNA-binding XRE family transcriptional regulator